MLRRNVQEPARLGATRRSSFFETVRGHAPLLARLAGLSVFNAVGFYLLFVYIVSWLQLADGIAPARALEINTISMVVLLAVMVGMGRLSDRVGRRPVLLGATAIGFIGALPLFWLMHHPDPLVILLGQLGFVVAVGMFLGAQPALMVEATPVAVRCTAIALGYNVTLGLVGGMTPLAATWLVYRTGIDLSPALLVMAAAAISFLTILSFGETSRMPLETA